MSKQIKDSDIATLPAAEAAVVLQERLHNLLTKLTHAFELIQSWPEAGSGGDDAGVHLESTARLIKHIKEILQAIQRVEHTVQSNQELRKKLQECPIPNDLLDLLDHGKDHALNPEIFVRGLLKESMGQLAGLKRRKLALGLLSSAVGQGLKKKQAAAVGAKRAREEIDATAAKSNANNSAQEESEPPAKKQKA
jgi:hypothetical protein